MMTLRQLAAEPPTIPTRTSWYLADLQRECPGVSVDLIRHVLKRLKGDEVECLGRGHIARWQRKPK